MNIQMMCIAMLATCSLSAQHMGTYTNHTLYSDAFGTEREVKVFMTEAVQELAEDEFPVLYVFDGQFEPFWGMVTQTVNYLSSVEKFPQMIVVGISTEHRPREFTPKAEDPRTPKDWGDTPTGESALLTAHLADDVFPFIESQYRTLPLRMAIGHSLAGTFVTHSVLDNEGLFNAVISVSPNMAYDYQLLPKKLGRILESGEVPKAWHYMGAGTVGSMENAFRQGAEMADSLYRAHPHPNLVWQYKTYEGLNHMNTPIAIMLDGFAAFQAFWNIDDQAMDAMLADTSKTYLAHLQAHYRRLSDWAGYDIELRADEINELAYVAVFEERWTDALEVINWGIALHPTDANLYDSRGECLEHLGDLRGALSGYQKALEVLGASPGLYDEAQRAYYEEAFTENATRVRGLLED